MRLEVSLHQKLQLQLKLAPQIIQSIEILQLPALDLREMIQQELDENETLELADAREEHQDTPLDEANRESHEDAEYERTYDQLESMSEEASWDFSMRRRAPLTEDGKDRKLEALQNTASRPVGFSDTLLEQITYLDVPERLLPMVRAIILSLDDGGFLHDDLMEIVRFVNSGLNGELPFTEEEAEAALALVQELDPPGVGARTIQEALALELDTEDPRYELKRRLVTEFLEDLNKNRLAQVARDLGIEIEDLSDLVLEIAQLSPRPG